MKELGIIRLLSLRAHQHARAVFVDARTPALGGHLQHVHDGVIRRGGASGVVELRPRNDDKFRFLS